MKCFGFRLTQIEKGKNVRKVKMCCV